MKPLYEFPTDRQQAIIELHLSGMFGGSGQVSKLASGAFGTAYLLTLAQGHFPQRLVAKAPSIQKFGTAEDEARGLEKLLYEVEHANKVFRNPWVNRINEIQIVHGWPFLWSRWRMGTLADLIESPAGWNLTDKLVTLMLVARALRICSERGIVAHQDLKPENIFFDDVRRTFNVPDGSGIHFHPFVADFGLANAFREIGQNSGSRPYMAPEQYSKDIISVRLKTS